jgi:hypothetical protein
LGRNPKEMLEPMPLGQNFTLIDVRAAALASFLFLLFAFAPGYVLCWCANVLSFRQRLLSTRLLIAVVISVSVSPALAYWLGSLSVWAIWTATAASAFAVVILLIRELRREIPRPRRVHVVFFLVVAAWVLIAIGSLVDLQIKDRLYFSSTVRDYAMRVPITAAIGRTGVRPADPFFFPGAPLPLRYHHFWYILCSLADQLGGKTVAPRQALIAGTVWSGIALIALIPLYLRFFDPKGSEAIHRRSLIGIGLLAVTGLDLIPTVLLLKFSHLILADMDWWNEQVASWLHSLLWAPHHVLALIACLTGFLLLWCIEHGSNARTHIALAACAFASAAGCSIHVTLVFAAFLVVWTAMMLARRCHRDCVALLATGVLAAILSLPYMFSLVSHGTGAAGTASGAFLQFSVRAFTVAEILLKTSNPDGGWLIQLVDAALLPLNYCLELGFFFAIGWLTLKRYRKSGKLSRQQLALSTMLITSVVICTFVRSSVIVNRMQAPTNDLGWRGLLLAQFVLILWSVDFWPAWTELTRHVRITLLVMLVLGGAGTAYQGIMLRMYPILVDQGAISNRVDLFPNRQLGRRTLAMRRAYAQLGSILPEGATLQFNPRGVTNAYFWGLYANRQVVVFDEGCGSYFGRQDCNRLLSQISPVFDAPASPHPSDMDPIDVLVFQDTDPVWADRRSWIWQTQPFVANDYFRAVPAQESSLHRSAN